MSDRPLISHLKRLREHAGLSQQALAARIGVSRQALIAIEASRQVPSTRLSLGLARALGCRVEDLFQLPGPEDLVATVVGTPRTRVLLGRVRDRWVAHPLGPESSGAADGLLTACASAGAQASVRPLGDPARLATSALVAGCAPLLGLLAQRAGRQHAAATVGWVQATSGRSLDLLAEGLVHVAGLHLVDADSREANLAAVRSRFPGQHMVVVNLTCWRQGLLLAPGNPRGVGGVQDLRQPGLRVAQRGPGAGATKLLRGLLAGDLPAGPFARGHAEVAQLVRVGAADAGVAIEAVALAAGLDFLPLSEERFDLVLPADLTRQPGVVRLLDALAGRSFRAEAAHIPGYDLGVSGQSTSIEAA